MKLSGLAEEKHDRNEDLVLQLDEFATFMWETAPKLVKEAETVENLKNETLGWCEDIRDRARSAGFRITDKTRISNRQTKFYLRLNLFINLILLRTLTLLSTFDSLSH